MVGPYYTDIFVLCTHCTHRQRAKYGVTLIEIVSPLSGSAMHNHTSYMFAARFPHLPPVCRLPIGPNLIYTLCIHTGTPCTVCRVVDDDVYRHRCMGVSAASVWLCGRAHVVPTRNPTCNHTHGHGIRIPLTVKEVQVPYLRNP